MTPYSEGDGPLGKRKRIEEDYEELSDDEDEAEQEGHKERLTSEDDEVTDNDIQNQKKKQRTDKDRPESHKGKRKNSNKNTPKKQDPKADLLKIFDPDYMEEMIEKLKTTLPIVPKSNSFNYGRVKNNISCSINLIDFACKNVDGPPDIEQALQVPTILTYIGKGYSNLQGLDLTSILIRYSIMLAVWRVWAVLEIDCRQLAQDTLNGAPDTWISPLVMKVRNHLLYQRTETTVLRSVDFLPGVKKDIPYALKPTKQAWTMRHLPQECVIDGVLDALGIWLECPREIGKNALWRDQGHLIEVLVAHSGGNYVCFLEETWKAFQNPKKLIGQRQNGAAKKAHWMVLSADIEGCMKDHGRKNVIEGFKKVNDILMPFVDIHRAITMFRTTQRWTPHLSHNLSPNICKHGLRV
ncbi:hypothetical protein NEOLEDRAFT_1181124 [Neolentinus lepideus HHB14362 ss-1]|uniref:Uncharacterized protein n=1 Tax=Neolentinus lepideus HHB14362 ss-1 TaxID=1314782 RepID=A0A165QCW8_9AGAM|nr:hypothetical protein NEOLEDRAFT_1181124 [Neolentinus lepideus HHB14362 ss-1]